MSDKVTPELVEKVDDALLEKLIAAVLNHTDIGLRNGDEEPALRMHKNAVKADMIEALALAATPLVKMREALEIIADENSWCGFTPMPKVERMRELARAALSSNLEGG